MATKLAPKEISGLDPDKLMAVIGKRLIHPGGRESTQALLRRAQIASPARMPDVGCGVADDAFPPAQLPAALLSSTILWLQQPAK